LGDAHVIGEDQLYSATLSVEISDDGNWLVYSSSTPATLLSRTL
jgi:hypothetical protein